MGNSIVLREECCLLMHSLLDIQLESGASSVLSRGTVIAGISVLSKFA